MFQKKFDFDSKILDAFWCYFTMKNNEKQQKTSITKNEEDETKMAATKCLCVREKGLLTFLMPSGQIHTLPLPFLVHVIN